MTSSRHVYEVRPRKDHRGVDLISDALPFGRLFYDGPIGRRRRRRGRLALNVRILHRTLTLCIGMHWQPQLFRFSKILLYTLYTLWT